MTESSKTQIPKRSPRQIRAIANNDPLENVITQRVKRPPGGRKRPLRVTLAGGGPVGLVAALTLKSLMKDQVRIRMYDPRWHSEDGSCIWKGPQHGNQRRSQVVTVQSRVWSQLPKEVLDRLFSSPIEFQEMWPYGPDSLPTTGRPRNIRIRVIEDKLLTLVQEKTGIDLFPRRFDPNNGLQGTDILILCDGPRSGLRRHFAEEFGEADTALYGIPNDRHPLFFETVLGLEVKSGLSPAKTVILTAANNRFLLNSLYGRGFLNMRLTAQEAREVVGIDNEGIRDCIQSRPCLMRRDRGSVFFRCPTHGTMFKPAVDPYSFLWPRILDGLRLFDVTERDLVGITAFRLSTPIHRPRFTAELAPGCYGFLLGDAANAIHFWPGRGLNCGLKGALSLAHLLFTRWRGRAFRDSDFTQHEGFMHQLQYRNKMRAWRVMQMKTSTGEVRTIDKRVQRGLDSPFDPVSDRQALLTRMVSIRERLAGRVEGELPSDEELLSLLERVSPVTLKVLVESGAWITKEVGGEEVDIGGALRQLRTREPVGQGAERSTRKLGLVFG